MRQWQRTGWAIAFTMALLTGCQAGSGPSATREEVAAPEGEMGGLADNDAKDQAPAASGVAATRQRAEKSVGNAAAPAKPGQPAEPSTPSQGRYIIRRAAVTLQVPDVRKAMGAIQDVAKAQRGFVSDSNLQATEGQTPSAVMTLRVPAAHFDAVLGALSGVGQVRARQVTGEDVSIEFVDTGARIRNLQREEGELLRLLNRAGKLSEVLEVERELARVRGEVEQAQGRLRQLSSLVDLATIEITLSEAVQVVSSSPWQLGPVFENAWANAQRELAGTVATVIAAMVWLVAYVLPIGLPMLLLFLLAGWALRRWVVDRRKLMPGSLYDKIWAGTAVALLALAFPPLLGIVALVAVIAAIFWVGSGALRSLKRKSAYKD